MSYSDYDEESEDELELEPPKPVEDPLMKDMVAYCKYG